MLFHRNDFYFRVTPVNPDPKPDKGKQGIRYDVSPGQHVPLAAVGQFKCQPQVNEFVKTQAGQGRSAKIVALETLFTDVVVALKRSDIPARLAFRQQRTCWAMVNFDLA